MGRHSGRGHRTVGGGGRGTGGEGAAPGGGGAAVGGSAGGGGRSVLTLCALGPSSRHGAPHMRSAPHRRRHGGAGRKWAAKPRPAPPSWGGRVASAAERRHLGVGRVKPSPPPSQGGAPSYTAKRGASARRHLGSGQRSPFALPSAPSPASPHCGVQDPLSTPPTPSPRPPLVEPHGGPHPPSSLRPPRVPPCCVKEASARNHTLLRRCRHPPLPNPSILSPTPQNPHPHPTPSVPPSPHSTQCSPAVPSALCLGLVPPSWPRLRPCGAAMQLWGRSSRGLIGAFWKGRGCGGALGGALGISPPP